MIEKAPYCDFHCHLDDERYEGNLWQLIDRCLGEGIARLITVADCFEKKSLAKTEEVLAYHSAIRAVCGAHPHHADHYASAIEANLLAFLQNDGIVAVGEVGLDYHYDFSSRENQINVFKRQIAIAREAELPLVIHSRNAEDEVLEILAGEKFLLPVVFHCYTGNQAAAEEILKRGYGISISGIVTFKKADALREIVKIIPLPQLFSETDSPYLSPEPRRGEVNTPLNVVHVVQKIASVKNMDVEQLNAAIAENLKRLQEKNFPGKAATSTEKGNKNP